MVKGKNIGIIGIQGAISEHEKKFKKIFASKDISGNVRIINKNDDIKEIDGLVIPGGESITISKVLFKSNLYKSILKRIKENTIPIMGTCAGCVLLASKIIDGKQEMKIFKAMDMKVKRNAFGRQRDSFEQDITVPVLGKKPFPAVFIRAPKLVAVNRKAKVIAELLDGTAVAAQEGKWLVTAFHPELTDDDRFHRYFQSLIGT